jgi:hypothetical protein
MNDNKRRWDRSTLKQPDTPLFSSAANRTDSSQAGAKAMYPTRELQYRRVLELLRSKGEHGATNEEVQGELPGMKPSSETRAMNDLVRLGLAKDSGLRRKSSAGVNVIIWIST